MNFDFTDDQEQLRDAVRKWVDKGYDFERRKGITAAGGFSRAAYGEMASQPPPFEAARVPTLLIQGEDSYLSYDHLIDAHRAALGGLLQVATVPGGHTMLWDALEETAAAIASFLAQ